ncbi:MAG: hypothetical protein Q7J16_02090 [Candidatus Cloacimonadales bacterium]|nr:hypothetical protein [Candidatus Cloacimonadales bacterium]
MNNIDNLIEINQKKGLPRKYIFNQFIRWFTLIFGMLAVVYSGWLIFAKISTDSSTFQKFVPFAILFLALNSVMKNLFSLNKIVFRQENISFRYLGRNSFTVAWNDLRKIEFADDKRKLIRLKYQSEDLEKMFDFPMSFPNMLEIINSIAEMCPDLEYDEFIGNVVVTPKEKAQYYKRRESEKQEQAAQND